MSSNCLDWVDGAQTRKPQWPKQLRKGDCVALFSPASHGGKRTQESLLAAQQYLTNQGLRVYPQAQPASSHAYLDASDSERALAFEHLYTHPDIEALFATRGGYGSLRMMRHLNLPMLKKAPAKIVIGMSDVTTLLTFVQEQLGVVTCHGPCLASPDFIDSQTREENLTALFGSLLTPNHATLLEGEVLHWPQHAPSTLSGQLSGGCLSVLSSASGTPWQMQPPAGNIVFLEDVGESPYRLDRCLTQLIEAGTLAHIKALVFGRLHRCSQQPDQSDIKAMLKDRFLDASFPLIWQVPAGHGGKNLPLPLGGEACLKKRDSRATLHCQWHWKSDMI